MALAALAQAGVIGYYRFPTLHGDRIVFAAEGDLWAVSTAGGSATRLTTHEGNEMFARFSPDGRWLAFSAEYQGNTDVYVMPADGGEPERLTFHPGPDEVITWRPDSTAVIFRTRRLSGTDNHNLFEIPRGGGQPRLVNVGVAATAAFSPDGRYLAFNRFADEFRTWKRYTGGTAQDVWLADLAVGAFRKITDWPGSDLFPMWQGERVYFASDRDDRMNLYSCRPDGSDVRQHTFHDEYDVRWPDAQGGRIVYMHAGDLWLLDLASGAHRPLEITLPTDRVQRRPRVEDAGKTLDSFDLDAKGKRLTISSRGEVWVTPTKPGRVIQLTRSSGVRERAAAFSPDGKQVAVITDETGEQEIGLLDTAGKEPPRVLTAGEQGWLFPPVWSPDGKKLAYADLTMTLYVVDVASGDVQTIDDSDVWEIREYAFSPDSRWLAYVKEEPNHFSAIYLCNLGDGTTHQVTSGFTQDSEPTWDPKGKYLYFLSARAINPVLDFLDSEHISLRATRPCVLVLAKGGKSPLLPEELLDEKKDAKPKHAADESADSDEAEDDEAPAEVPSVAIDLDALERRVVELPVEPDNYADLRATPGKLLYLSLPVRGLLDSDGSDQDEKPENALHVFDFKRRKDDVLIEALRDYTLSRDGKRIAYRIEDDIVVSDLDAVKEQAAEKQPDKDAEREVVAPSQLPLLVDPAEEWAQILLEAWRLQRDFYWTETMAGIDWPAMWERYSPLLPRLGSRRELNDLLGQLIGELGTSHTYVWGGDIRAAEPVGVGLLGADLEPDPHAQAYRFVRILRPEPWETDVRAPLTLSHAGVQDGDYLFAINGQELCPTDNLYERLANLAKQQVLLTIGTQPDRSDARDVQIETLAEEHTLRYRDWRRRNREYVAAQSGGRIGYLHLPDMMGDGLASFIRGFYPQINTDGLIIDARYNGGGFVSQMLINRLTRQVVAFDQPRRGRTMTYPYPAHVGHKVVLVNEHAGSDGDIFPAAFQTLGLGPIIGTRTWGGVIGIRGDKTFIDGGVSTQPEFAFWDLHRGWNLENHGVEPDIEVDILPADWVADRDPQLDCALEELARRLEAEPIVRPQPPAIPDKSHLPRR
jgi:tricorn protease